MKVTDEQIERLTKERSYQEWLRECAMLEFKGFQKELYKKHKRVVDDVCEYLRIRSYVDGVR